MGLDWTWTGTGSTGRQGGREQESLVGSRGTPHPLAVGFPAIPTPIPLPIPTGRGMPWPFPRLANLARKVLSSAGLLSCLVRGGGEGPAANPGQFQDLAVFRVMDGTAIQSTAVMLTDHE